MEISLVPESFSIVLSEEEPGVEVGVRVLVGAETLFSCKAGPADCPRESAQTARATTSKPAVIIRGRFLFFIRLNNC